MSDSEPRPIHFFDRPIEVTFSSPPARQKLPHCPTSFIWDGKTYRIVESLSEWTNFSRRGSAARNMSPSHAGAAAERGSLNVGRFFFRVRVDTGQLFDIYYDRAIKSVDDHRGHWFVYRELANPR